MGASVDYASCKELKDEMLGVGFLLKSSADMQLLMQLERTSLSLGFLILGERGMASSSLGFQEEKRSEDEISGVVSPLKLERNPIRAADVHPTLKNHHEELIGRTVKVWRPVDEMFHRGKITSFDRSLWTHQIAYDGGKKESVNLSEEIWELVGDEELSGGEQDTIPGSGLSTAALFPCPTSGFCSEDSDVPLPDDMRQKRGQALWFGNSGPSTKNDMDQAIHRNNAGAASEWSVSRLATVQKRLRPLRCPSSTRAGNEVAVTLKENVGGYLVKASAAPTLRLIFAKHGDIASNFSLKLFPEVVAGMLEKVSNILKSLLEDDFSYVLSEWDRMMAVTTFIALLGMDLSWLEKPLSEIEEVSKIAVKAASRNFEARKKLMMAAKKRFKEIQRSLI